METLAAQSFMLGKRDSRHLRTLHYIVSTNWQHEGCLPVQVIAILANYFGISTSYMEAEKSTQHCKGLAAACRS
jgi:hypothetical protein